MEDSIRAGHSIDWKQIQNQLICDNAFVAKSVNSLETLKRVIEEERCASYYVKSTSGKSKWGNFRTPFNVNREFAIHVDANNVARKIL